MRRFSPRSRICIWLGILSIVVQSFMPLWKANAAAEEAERYALGFSSICLALAESSERVPNNNLPQDQDDPANHCVLCQLPSFDHQLAGTDEIPFTPFESVIVRYISHDWVMTAGRIHYALPPSRAPPA